MHIQAKSIFPASLEYPPITQKAMCEWKLPEWISKRVTMIELYLINPLLLILSAAAAPKRQFPNFHHVVIIM